MTAHMTDEDREQADRDYDQMISLLREQLAADLAAALTHLYAAAATIRELSSSQVYDIEWAEGGGDTAAAVSMLTMAINQTSGAKAIAALVAAR